MSAPRMICAAPDHGTYSNAAWSDGEGVWTSAGTKALEGASTYHHDDVVRELVEALKGLLHHEIAHVGPHAGARVIAARAALAKIAQEG